MPSVPIAVLTILCLVNLALLLGVLRRVNDLARGNAGLARNGAAPSVEPNSPLPGAGDTIGQFAARTTDGETVTTRDLTGRTLVGFFTTGCPPCAQFAPAFSRYALDFPGGRDRVLAVIAGGTGDPSALAARLGPVARVIVEPGQGAASNAFGVQAFPAACLLDDSRVVAADFDLRSLGLTRPATSRT